MPFKSEKQRKYMGAKGMLSKVSRHFIVKRKRLGSNFNNKYDFVDKKVVQNADQKVYILDEKAREELRKDNFNKFFEINTKRNKAYKQREKLLKKYLNGKHFRASKAVKEYK